MKKKYGSSQEDKVSVVRERGVQYVVDSSGKATFVLVPRKEWESVQTKYRKLQKKLEVFEAIRDGILEVKSARRKGKKLQSLSDFLNESKS